MMQYRRRQRDQGRPADSLIGAALRARETAEHCRKNRPRSSAGTERAFVPGTGPNSLVMHSTSSTQRRFDDADLGIDRIFRSRGGRTSSVLLKQSISNTMNDPLRLRSVVVVVSEHLADLGRRRRHRLQRGPQSRAHASIGLRELLDAR